MIITVKELHEGFEYVPFPGLEYEVGEDNAENALNVTLRRPVRGRAIKARDKFQEALKKDGDEEVIQGLIGAGQIVAKGKWPTRENLIDEMLDRVLADFFICATPMPRRQADSTAESDLSESQEESKKPNGPPSGESEETDSMK